MLGSQLVCSRVRLHDPPEGRGRSNAQIRRGQIGRRGQKDRPRPRLSRSRRQSTGSNFDIKFLPAAIAGHKLVRVVVVVVVVVVLLLLLLLLLVGTIHYFSFFRH